VQFEATVLIDRRHPNLEAKVMNLKLSRSQSP
jgi:hypothetical protein